MATATHRPRPQTAQEAAAQGPTTRQAQNARHSLQLIADALGMSVESFYASAQASPGTEAHPQIPAAQQLSIDGADLLQAFSTLSNPADRRLCIAFVRRLAAKRSG